MYGYIKMPSEAYKNALRKLNMEESYRNKVKKQSNKLTHDFFKKTTKAKEKGTTPKKKCYSLCDNLF